MALYTVVIILAAAEWYYISIAALTSITLFIVFSSKSITTHFYPERLEINTARWLKQSTTMVIAKGLLSIQFRESKEFSDGGAYLVFYIDIITSENYINAYQGTSHESIIEAYSKLIKSNYTIINLIKSVKFNVK